MKREFSAGGIVYKKCETRDERCEILWLVRRPTENPEYRGNLGWSFPKGWIDDRQGGEEPGPKASGEKRASETEMQEAALREVSEEGGVEAKIIKKLPTIKVFFTDNKGNKVLKFITYYLMEYAGDNAGGAGWETAETRWVRSDEAMKLLAHKDEKELLRQAERLE